MRSGRRPELILHAGQHKTGTTSLQSFILRHRIALGENGVHVVRCGQSVAGDHHRLMMSNFDGLAGKVRLALLRAEAMNAYPSRLLISSETTAEAILAGRGHRIVDALRSAGTGTIKLLLYLRSPFALANATYSEIITGLEFGGPGFADYLRAWNVSAYERYDRFLELGARDDVELIVRPYDSEVRQSIARDLVEALNVWMPVDAEPRLNTSLGPIALEAVRIIARELDPMAPELRWLVSDRLREIGRTLAEKPFWGIDGWAEQMLADADRRTDEFARAVWGRGWRERVGEERRPLNMFDPTNGQHRDQLNVTLRTMRAAIVPLVEKAEPRRAHQPAADGKFADGAAE